jgi:hypothetical protein
MIMSAPLTHVPSAAAVGKLLSDLLDRFVAVKAVPKLSVPAASAVSTYVFEDGTLAAACVCDLGFAAAAGSALALIPASLAASVIKTGKLPENMAENLTEVFNVASSLFASVAGKRVRLRELTPPGVSAPSDARALLNVAGWRLDLDVTITGYPVGKVSLVAV